MAYTLINRKTGDVRYNAPVLFFNRAFIYMDDGTVLDSSCYTVKNEQEHDYDTVVMVRRNTGMNADARRMFNSRRVALMYRRCYRWHKRVNGGRGLQWAVDSKNQMIKNWVTYGD